MKGIGGLDGRNLDGAALLGNLQYLAKLGDKSGDNNAGITIFAGYIYEFFQGISGYDLRNLSARLADNDAHALVLSGKAFGVFIDGFQQAQPRSKRAVISPML